MINPLKELELEELLSVLDSNEHLNEWEQVQFSLYLRDAILPHILFIGYLAFIIREIKEGQE